LACVIGTSVPFTSCGTGHIALKNIDVSPFPPKAKDTVTVTATGTLDKDITEGSYDLKVKLGVITLLHQTGDICTFSSKFSCPQPAGDVTLGDSLTLPDIVPKGKYTITLSATDSAGQLFCFDADLDLSAIVLGEQDDDEHALAFADFIETFGKTYSEVDLPVRYNIFKANYDAIKNHNAQGLSWTMDINEFADMTWEEFKTTHMGYKRSALFHNARQTVNLSGLFTVPTAIDWSAKGAVTGIKNQEQCGSCWAFSTTGSTEGAVEIKTGRLTSLSEQQLVDCSDAYGNMGCNGGLMDNAFQYIIANKGICSEAEYPYTAVDGTCKTCSVVSTISSYKDVAQNDEAALEAAVAQGPVSVAIEADQSGFQFYSGGVFDGTCGTALDHGVLAVGYGTQGGQKFWKVKNSWGSSWGLSGYILMAKDISSTSGQCGIAMEPSYPIA